MCVSLGKTVAEEFSVYYLVLRNILRAEYMKYFYSVEWLKLKTAKVKSNFITPCIVAVFPKFDGFNVSSFSVLNLTCMFSTCAIHCHFFPSFLTVYLI